MLMFDVLSLCVAMKQVLNRTMELYTDLPMISLSFPLMKDTGSSLVRNMSTLPLPSPCWARLLKATIPVFLLMVRQEVGKVTGKLKDKQHDIFLSYSPAMTHTTGERRGDLSTSLPPKKYTAQLFL